MFGRFLPKLPNPPIFLTAKISFLKVIIFTNLNYKTRANENMGKPLFSIESGL